METKLEWILKNTYKANMVSYLSGHPEEFKEAVRLATDDKLTVSVRAAWILWSCMEENDPRVQEYVKTIIDILPEKKDNHQRELLKILQKMDIDEKYEGILFDHCVFLWEKTNKKPSVRFNAFKMMMMIVQRHPDLTRELVSFTQEQYMDSLSPGVQRSVRKMLRKIL